MLCPFTPRIETRPTLGKRIGRYGKMQVVNLLGNLSKAEPETLTEPSRFGILQLP